MASYSDNSDALFWKKIKQQSKDKQINIVSPILSKLLIGNLNQMNVKKVKTITILIPKINSKENSIKFK